MTLDATLTKLWNDIKGSSTESRKMVVYDAHEIFMEQTNMYGLPAFLIWHNDKLISSFRPNDTYHTTASHPNPQIAVEASTWFVNQVNEAVF